MLIFNSLAHLHGKSCQHRLNSGRRESSARKFSLNLLLGACLRWLQLNRAPGALHQIAREHELARRYRVFQRGAEYIRTQSRGAARAQILLGDRLRQGIRAMESLHFS